MPAARYNTLHSAKLSSATTTIRDLACTCFRRPSTAGSKPVEARVNSWASWSPVSREVINRASSSSSKMGRRCRSMYRFSVSRVSRRCSVVVYVGRHWQIIERKPDCRPWNSLQKNRPTILDLQVCMTHQEQQHKLVDPDLMIASCVQRGFMMLMIDSSSGSFNKLMLATKGGLRRSAISSLQGLGPFLFLAAGSADWLPSAWGADELTGSSLCV